MGFLWATAIKDLRRRRRDPLALVMWAGIPFAIALLIKLTFGGGSPRLEARLLVADLDDSFASRFLAGAFDQGPLSEMVVAEQVGLEEGRSRLDRGDGSALLIIPTDFGRAVFDNQPVALELVTNPEQRILPRLIEEILSTLLDAAFYLQQIFDQPIRRLNAGVRNIDEEVPDSLVVATSLSINQTMNTLAPYVFPPLIELRIEGGDEDDGEGAPGVDLGTLFLMGMLFLSLLFIAQGMSEDLWQEKSQRTLHRTLAAPQHMAFLIGGKLLAAAFLMVIVSAVGLAAARWVFGLPLANLALAVVWAALFGIMMLVLFYLVQIASSSARAGNILTAMVVFPLAMVGGSFFPLDVMPESLARVGRWTPNGWALGHFEGILLGTTSASALLGPALVVLGVTAAAAIVSAHLVRSRFAQT